MPKNKMRIAERDDLLGGVGILHDEIAGVAREVVIFDLALPSFAQDDHLTL